ncbi:MAG: HEPN domain-containing protein [Anaerolineales bacterium]|nr:HEPN domain-containing protein [Anaerolineales bacterium]
MTEPNALAAKLELMIQKASRSLAAASQLVVTGDYDFASSRAYYAAFYAMQAALLTKNLTPAKHAGAIRAFSQHFIKTGVFPTEFNQSISRLFRNRQTGDYALGLSINEDKARQDIQTAESVVEAILTYLKEERFL